MARSKISFQDWMKQVDKAISDKVGLTSSDLADICYRDLYDDGVSASSAARKAIKSDMY